MKKLKLFFACLLMAVLSIGQVWADPAAAGTTLFSENFGSYSANNVPSGSVTTATGRVVYGNGSVTYTCTASGTKIYNENTGGGTAPEILVAKNGGTFVIAGIPSGDAQAITVSWTQNKQSLDVAPTGTGYSGSVSGKPSAVGTRSFDITVADGADATFTLTFAATGTSNVRVDDILVTVKTAGEGATPTCATPTFDPEDGETFSDDIDVEIAAESGTTIYYTTDGTDPTTSSSVYSTALNFTETTTLKAIATKAGSNNSAVATATYTKVVPFDGSILEITKDDFVASYASNNGDHEKDGITYNTNQVCLSSSSIQFQKTNGLLYNKTTLGEIVKIEITKTGSNNLVVYSGTTENPSSTEVTGSVSGNVTTYTFASGNGFFAIKCNSTAASNVDPIKIYYVYSAPAVATPSISGATPFATTTTVTLGCTTDGASIYYTTDGTDPSSSSTLYNEPFELNASATVKAIAILGSDQSSIASKEFEKVTSYTTLAAIYDKAVEVSSTATDIYVTFGGWKVSAKTSNNVFLTDGTNGAVIYGSGHGFNAGDVLTGTVACKVQLYKGFAELTALTSGTAGLIVTPGSVGDPVVKTWDQLSAVNTGALVKLENLTYDGSSLSDGVNTIPTHTTFYTATFEAGKSYNLTGVYQYYDTDGQILPRSAADVEEIIETFTVTYNNAPDHGTLTIKNGEDIVTSGSAVNEGTVLTIETTPASGYKLAGVTVNGSAYAESTLTLTDDVTIAASFEENLADPVNSYVLSVIGTETPQSVSGLRVGDKVTLPPTATACSKTFVGWDLASDCSSAPAYAPGAEYTLALDNKLYAVYATPGDNAATEVFATTSLGSTNTVTEGYAVSAVAGAQTGYYQDGGSVGNKRHVQVMVSNTETQIIPSLPSTITVTAKIGGGSTFDALVNPVYAILLNASGEEIGDPVALTSAIEVKEGKDYTVNMATSNYADVRGVRVYHVKENKSGSGFNVRYYSISLSYATESYSDYSTDCQAQVATPVISGVTADGVYTEGKEISITCATDGATIYYAVDSDEEPSTEYTDAFTVGTAGAHTVKAKAVKTGMAASEIASVSFTINLPLSTMDQIFAAATAAGSTATDANIAFGNWVVSGVSTNGKNVYVTDGTKGFIIFDNGGEMGFAVGDVLSGTVACKVQLYKGAAELTTLSSTTEGLNIAKEGVITPAVKAINALSGINTGAAVTINSVQFDGTNLSDGANEIKPYNSLFAYDALESGKYYNVTGIYLQFDATKEILPRSAADIQEVDLADPEISYTPASATIELGEDLPGTVFANPHELAISYNSNNEAVATVSNTGVIALGTETGTAVITASFAGDATYAAANVTYTITVNPASVTENVVILAVYDTKYYAMSTNNASSAFTAIAVEYDGSKVTVKSEAEKTAIQWTKKTSGDNTTFQDADSKYMKSADGTSMSLQDAVCNWVWDATGEYYKISGTTRTFFYQNGTGFKNFATSNFNKSGYSDKAQVIVIAPENIVITSKADPQLAYDPTSVTLTVGQTFVPATLTYAEGFDGLAAVTYESSNTDLATVEGGVVSLVADATGTATITATFAGNENYQSGSASYTITVNEAGDDLSGTWVLASSVVAGDEIIIMGANNADVYTMGKQNTNNRAAVASTLSEDVLNPGAATKVFTLVDAGEGKFAIRASNGNYLTSATSGTSNNLLEAADYDLDNAKWTISIEEGVASIVAAAGSKTVMQYNSGSTIFSCYGSASQKPVKIFKRDAAPTPVYETVRSGLTAGNYYTICYPKAMTDIQGATLWSFVGKDANFAYIEQETATTIEAGKPYIMYATASTVTAVLGDETNAPGANGAIHGTFSDLTQDQLNTYATVAGNDLYLVIGNELRRATGEGTGSNTLPAQRAFVVLGDIPAAPAHMPAHVRRMPMQTDQAQGFENIEASEKPMKLMIDGQMYILRGEKVYDATGRLVK